MEVEWPRVKCIFHISRVLWYITTGDIRIFDNTKLYIVPFVIMAVSK